MTQLDFIKAAARKIATAEGFGLADKIPTDARNPGDLKLGVRFPDETVIHKSEPFTGTINGMTIFLKADWNADIDDHTDGCATLYREIRDILNGKSVYYHVGMTIQQIADLWTNTDPEAWAKDIAESFGVTPDTTLEQIVAAAGVDPTGQEAA